jgi:uncharacterized lipoprotein YddW (UPF0748 family)
VSQTRLAMKSFLAFTWRGWPAGFRAFFSCLAAIAVLFAVHDAAAVSPGDMETADDVASDAGEATAPQRRIYLWVVRGALEDSVRFTAMADSAARAGCTDLLLQARGRGDAWYRSSIEPAPIALERRPPDGIPHGARPSEECLRFDAFAAGLRAAHARGLRVHAWLNVFLVGNKDRPGSAHVLRREPGWQVALKDGRTIDRIGEAERRRLGVEGAYLSPGNPEVLAYLESIVTEIGSRYPIDGLHLDYIRYPYPDAGYDVASLEAFHTLNPGASASGPAWDEWRRDRVSLCVETLSRAAHAVRPDIEVSAAVLPDPFEARRICKQDWPRWVREGWIDYAMTMAYTASADRFSFLLRVGGGETGDSLRVVPGIGFHKVDERGLALMLERIGPDRARSFALFSETEFMQADGLRRVLRSWGGK